MSTSYGGTPPGITGTHYGGPGLGVLGSLVPSGGLDGAGYLYAGLSLPADAGKEVRGPITRWPSGALTVYEDSAFSYTGDADYALYALYVDGVASTTDIGYGAGIGRFELAVGDVATLSGNVDLGDVASAGTLADAGASALSGDVALGVISIAGGLVGVGSDAAYPLKGRSASFPLAGLSQAGVLTSPQTYPLTGQTQD
jgi:hypothetical protein